MTTSEVSISLNNGLSFMANIDQYKVPMDTTNEFSQQAGPSPKKLMLAALGGCTGMDIVSILNKMKVSYEDFSIDIKASLTEGHPKIFKDVHVFYKIKLAEEDQQKMEKAVNLSQEKYCGINAMFKSFAKVSSNILFL